jgi:hypothetical protein
MRQNQYMCESAKNFQQTAEQKPTKDKCYTEPHSGNFAVSTWPLLSKIVLKSQLEEEG